MLAGTMKPPLIQAILSGLAFLGVFLILLPSVMQMLNPASSGVCLNPRKPNQIKSIQMFPESRAAFFPPAFARRLEPEIVRVIVNPYYCPDPTPVLFVKIQDGTMEVNEDWVRRSRGVFDTPFTEPSVAAVLANFKAPRSPQQGEIDTRELYLAIAAVGAADIRDTDVPDLEDLSSYTVSYIHPYKGTSSSVAFSLMVAFACTMSVYQSAKKKATPTTDGSDPGGVK